MYPSSSVLQLKEFFRELSGACSRVTETLQRAPHTFATVRGLNGEKR